MTGISLNDKILVTGASGFIGTNLMDSLTKLGHTQLANFDSTPPLNDMQESFWRKGDIMDARATNSFFDEYRPTHVVHLAARCDCDEKTTVEEGYRVNTIGTENILRAVKASSSVRRLIVTSSQFVFNREEILPKGDDDYAPKTVYGQSKIITEKLTRGAGLSCGWTIIRPTNVWGPWHLRHTKQFFRILQSGLYFHPGKQPVIRSYAYVGNVVDQILKILFIEEPKIHGRTLYVGDPPLDIFDWVNGFSQVLRGKSVRVLPRPILKGAALIGDLISNAIGKDFFITSSRFRSMTYSYLTPMDQTFAILGCPKFTLREGILQTTEWLREFEASGIKIYGNRSMIAQS